MPFIKYFYEVTSALSKNNFIIQHLNFNPAQMLHIMLFSLRIKYKRKHFFTQNEKHTETENIHGCLIGVYFLMKNTLQYYERNYDRVQDVLSDIGGISSIVLTIASTFNMLINNFIIVLNTEDLVLNDDLGKYGNPRELNKKPTILKKAKNIMYPPRRPYQP